MTYDLLVIGDCAIDEYMLVESSDFVEDPNGGVPRFCFFHGSKIPVKSFKATPAGNACHVGVGASRLGLNVAVYTELGNDDNGNKLISVFQENGVNTDLSVLTDNTPTNVHAIITFKNDRTIFSYHEPRKYKLPFENLSTRWIYYTSLAEGFDGFQAELAEYLNNRPDTLLAFNPGTLQLKAGPDKLSNILKRTDVIFVNKEEAYRLINEDIKTELELRDLHERLQKLGPKLSVITKGKDGSSVFDGSRLIEANSPEIDFEIVDKTGSGDAYASGFLSALAHNKPIDIAIAWGNANSAATLRHIGGIDNLLHLSDLVSEEGQ
jgi:sugar/nucleoside kinase (ribokinase family)